MNKFLWDIWQITLWSQWILGHIYTFGHIVFPIFHYLQLNKNPLSRSRSETNISPNSEQFLFDAWFALHSNTLLSPFPIRLIFGRWILNIRSSYSGFIIMSSGFFCFWPLQSEASSTSATTNVEVEPVGNDWPKSWDSIWGCTWPLLYWYTALRFCLVLLEVFFTLIIFGWLQSGFEGVVDNPNVFLRTFSQPCSITRRLLWEVFMRNAQGNKIK